MKIKIKTLVNSPLQTVWQGFDKKLFLKLSPPFPKVELLRFDGCVKGDEVHLKLLMPFFPQYWNAEIIENTETENEIYFIDKGIKLPFFLTKWHHKHLLLKADEFNTYIVDDINFSTGTIITDLLFYPFMYLQFLYRVPVYKRYFQK